MKRKNKLLEKRYCNKFKEEKGLCQDPYYCNMPLDLVCQQCVFSVYKTTKFGDTIYEIQDKASNIKVSPPFSLTG